MATISKAYPQKKPNLQASAKAADSQHAPLHASKKAARTQEEDDAADKMLREFDLNDAYGPCLGITRSERWERARALGLDPPAHVLELVHADASGARDKCLWEGQV